MITSFSSQWLDLKWMIAFAFSRDVPMWVGWNARRESLNISNNIWPSSAQSTQSIFYLPQINQSPTSIAVVSETLKRALAFANQSKRDSIAVTYTWLLQKSLSSCKLRSHQNMIKYLLLWVLSIWNWQCLEQLESTLPNLEQNIC